MNSLNIDLRSGYLRVLALRDDSVKYSGMVKDFNIKDEEYAKEKLISEIKAAGGKKGRINVILPADIVRHKVYQLPSLDIEDAKKLVARELSKELKGQRFTFGVRRLMRHRRAQAGSQDILAEYVLADDAIRYLNFLKKCRIRPDVMTTSLEGSMYLLNRFRPETDGNEAFLEIGLDFLEIAVFNNGRLLDYAKVPMSSEQDERFRGKDMTVEQISKIKIYTIVDALYNFVMEFSKDMPEGKLTLLWVGGLGSLIEGIVGSISDGLGVKARLISPFKTEIENSSAFSALAGLSATSKTGQIVNLLPEETIDEKTRLLRRTVLTAALSFYVVLLGGGYIVLNQTELDLKISEEKIKALQAARSGGSGIGNIYLAGQQTLEKIASSSPILYRIFRDMANLTPSGVVLESIQIEKAQGKTSLKINATITYSDESFKNTVLSRFISSLDSSAAIKRKTPPEITTLRASEAQKEISVKATYEVVQ